MTPRSGLLRSITFLLMLIAGGEFAAAQATLPVGWRLPTSTELADDWRGTETSRKAEVVGDFDGDGKPDRAALLISIKSQNLGLFVLLAGDRAGYWRKLDVINDRQAIHAMGLELVRPGHYTTACGKGYLSCKPDAPKAIRLDGDALNYFKTESANRIFYLDKHTKSFRQVWMSD